ncbi:MAG: hypothetical protein L3K06_06055 [Thermoplasmata archaeon]|nr:hypothetical protein [Thermoplasmata archaeon]
MSDNLTNLVPLAALAATVEAAPAEDLPIAYVPRIPEAANFRELLERSVGWGRR